MNKVITDISTFNTIDNYALFAKQVDGVIIRIGYSGYKNGAIKKDAKFEKHFNKLKGKTKLGVYFTSQAVNANEAAKEAKWVANHIPITDAFELGVWIDIESAPSGVIGRADRISKALRTKNILTFCGAPELNRYNTGVYLSKYWAENKVEMSIIEDMGHSIWIAQYNYSCSYKGKYDMWQYTSNAIIEGAKGRVDMTMAYEQEKTEDDMVYMLSVGDFKTVNEAKEFQKTLAEKQGFKGTLVHGAKIKDVQTY